MFSLGTDRLDYGVRFVRKKTPIMCYNSYICKIWRNVSPVECQSVKISGILVNDQLRSCLTWVIWVINLIMEDF